VLDATADTTQLYAGQSTYIHANAVNTNWNINWTPASSLNSSSSFDPLASPPVTTTYVLTGTDQNGCPSSDSVTIEVKDVLCAEPEIFIPNAFSPNSDQNNDILYVRGNTIEKVYLAIYDRWGEILFETNSTSMGWDGTYKGKPVTADVYVYYVEITCYDKSQFKKKGNISVIR
jgi:gliding motility-associated-like protein